jgi:hypothetical protein
MSNKVTIEDGWLREDLEKRRAAGVLRDLAATS